MMCFIPWIATRSSWMGCFPETAALMTPEMSWQSSLSLVIEPVSLATATSNFVSKTSYTVLLYIIYNIYYILYTIQYTLYTIHYILYNDIIYTDIYRYLSRLDYTILRR